MIVDKDADLDDALERIIFGAFYQSGQSCIGVQRIIIHEDIYDTLQGYAGRQDEDAGRRRPKDRDTFIGPMISEKEAKRLKGWIDDAVDAGATLLCGGELRRRPCCEATLLEDVPADMRCQQGRGVRPAREPVRSSADFERGAGGGERQQVRPAGGHLHPRPIHKVLEPGTGSMSAAWWSTTSQHTGSTTCPMAG